ncbi:hypothetical protein A6F57_19860 [Alteromonas stellipolaris]|uniref:PKD domain-containing protein n=1 Tax=Alteromonas stellipolaris TaxID=233316 RepID=UPI0007B42A4B|nr:sialate O-acetylesterase [Alteromonas stellipolaris]ANB27237.1 hypothetical protein A6F57_19860 [Alteromonas stellipolaris]
MSIVFDNSGYIDGFVGYFADDFDITLPTFTITKTFAGLAGRGDGNTFLQNRADELRFRFGNGGSTMDLPPLPLDTPISDGRIVRVDGVITFTMGGNSMTANSTGLVDIREWGRASGTALMQGEVSGVGILSGEGRETITHDFDSGSAGDTIIVNQSAVTSGNNDGVLKNFTTGGFQGAATTSPSVANAGADQSNINAGDTVTLDSSASTSAVSRLWTEVTSTGVVLSDNTAVSPTFTAPSFTSLTEIIFELETTGSDESTDTDQVSFFVLEDGVVAVDPTITLDSKTYSYYTRKSDINGEAIFPVAGVITDLPAGAVAEYELDGSGNWVAMPTDSNGNFSDDIIISVQQNLVVRVSTNTDITATANYLTAAPIWLAWWQSNESGRGSSTQNSIRNNEITSSMVRPTCFKDGRWQYINDPTSEDSTGGSTWIRIAVEYAKLGQPIGVINVAVGGTSIERWIPSSDDLWTTRIMAETNEADCGGVTFTASLGGESNVGTDGATLRAWLAEMIDGLHDEFGSIHYLTDVPRTYTNGQGDTLRGEFDYIIENSPYCRFGGDTSVIDVETDSDGTHLKTGSQVNEAAMIRFNAFTAEEVVSNQPPTANAGPNQSVAAGAPVQLDASSSTQGTYPIESYEWTQTAGTDVTLSNPTTDTPEFDAPSSEDAQRISFDVVAIDTEGNRSASATVHIDVAAVVLNEILKIIERLDFELETQGDVNAYYGRANREVMKLKPSNPEGLVMDGDYLNLESNTITEVKIIAEGVSISSKTDGINLNKGEMIPRLGDMDIGKTGNIYFSIIVFVEGDDKGVVVSSKGAAGNKPMIYVTL